MLYYSDLQKVIIIEKSLNEMEKNQLPEVFNDYQEDLINFTKKFYKHLNDDLYFTHRYFLGWIDEHGGLTEVSGKSFRPSLMMLINESLGGKNEDILPIAMAIELFHNFSLIHDDIEDKDEYRRNRKTVWKIWGEPRGIISGSSMHALASKSIDLLKPLNEKKIALIRSIVSETCMQVIEGQFLDLSFESTLNINIENYLEMINKKTGALIEASAKLGAFFNYFSHEKSEQFSKLGKQFGNMFQIKDDILGIWGNDEFGKPIGSDILKKKKSLPVLHLLNESKGNDNRMINDIFANEQNLESFVKHIIGLMSKYKTEKYCNKILNENFKDSEKIITGLKIKNLNKENLKEINQFLVYRKK